MVIRFENYVAVSHSLRFLLRLSLRRPLWKQAVRLCVCLSVRAITLRRVEIFEICLRKCDLGVKSEVKFEDEPHRSTPSGSNNVSSKLMLITGVNAQV